jgi:hypothetical protein
MILPEHEGAVISGNSTTRAACARSHLFAPAGLG